MRLEWLLPRILSEEGPIQSIQIIYCHRAFAKINQCVVYIYSKSAARPPLSSHFAQPPPAFDSLSLSFLENNAAAALQLKSNGLFWQVYAPVVCLRKKRPCWQLATEQAKPRRQRVIRLQKGQSLIVEDAHPAKSGSLVTSLSHRRCRHTLWLLDC